MRSQESSHNQPILAIEISHWSHPLQVGIKRQPVVAAVPKYCYIYIPHGQLVSIDAGVSILWAAWYPSLSHTIRIVSKNGDNMDNSHAVHGGIRGFNSTVFTTRNRSMPQGGVVPSGPSNVSPNCLIKQASLITQESQATRRVLTLCRACL